jgi:hypothetical protein
MTIIEVIANRGKDFARSSGRNTEEWRFIQGLTWLLLQKNSVGAVGKGSRTSVLSQERSKEVIRLATLRTSPIERNLLLLQLKELIYDAGSFE